MCVEPGMSVGGTQPHWIGAMDDDDDRSLHPRAFANGTSSACSVTRARTRTPSGEHGRFSYRRICTSETG